MIEDVIEKVREEFVVDGGPGEKVLQELQGVCVYNVLNRKNF